MKDTKKKIVQESINYPPAYCNGSPHLGHAYEAFYHYVYYKLSDLETLEKLNSETTGEIIQEVIKKKKVKLNLGIDVLGLPIVLEAKKNLPLEKRSDPLTIRLKCQQLIKKNKLNWHSFYEKLGLTNLRDVYNYTTQDEAFNLKKEEAIKLLKEKGLLDVKPRPNLYCPSCETYLSKNEVSLVQVPTSEYYINALGEDGKNYKIMSKAPEYIVGAIIVAFNNQDERYKHLQNSKLKVIVNNIEINIPVKSSSIVNKNVGTGLTYIAAWGGQIDYKIISELGIKLEGSLLHDANGKIKKELKETYNFQNIEELRKKFNLGLELITDDTTMKKIIHTQRSSCNNQVVYLAAPQLYLDVPEDIKKSLCKKLLQKDILVYPNYAVQDIISYINKYRGWGLGRSDTYYGLQANFQGLSYKLDTWFISSMTHLLDCNTKIRFQGSQILKTWAFYSLILGELLEKKNLDRLIVHRLIVDPEGNKFSKSLNNAPDLKLLLEKYSLKYLRYYFLEKPLIKDIKFNEKQILDVEKLFTKLQNLKIKTKLEIAKKQKSETLVVKESLVKQIKENLNKKDFNLKLLSESNNSKIIDFIKRYKKFFSQDLELFEFSGFNFAIKSFIFYYSTIFAKEIFMDLPSLLALEICLELITSYLKGYD